MEAWKIFSRSWLTDPLYSWATVLGVLAVSLLLSAISYATWRPMMLVIFHEAPTIAWFSTMAGNTGKMVDGGTGFFP